MRSTEISLHGPSGGRKYLNAPERRRFATAARSACPEVRLFCLTLFFSGARISEILALTAEAVDLEELCITVQTLKRRKPGLVRQVPLPKPLLAGLNHVFDIRRRQRDAATTRHRLWMWSRTTAWRRVKEVMREAEITHTAAMPKGLRHGFGVNAIANFVPQTLVQRWLGHASLKTTAIYCDVCGPEERAFAARTWKR